jgi:hypothetical protein
MLGGGWWVLDAVWWVLELLELLELELLGVHICTTHTRTAARPHSSALQSRDLYA